MKYWTLSAALAAAVVLVGCGGGGDFGNSSVTLSGPRLLEVIAIPNWGTTTNASFDLGATDSANARYVYTDRNNKGLEVIDTANDTLVTTVGGFVGCNTGTTCVGANNDKSGPDGVDYVFGTNNIMVGDVDTVKVVDKTTNTIITTIAINDPTTGLPDGVRADEGCFDPDHSLYMISTPGSAPPFATFISTAGPNANKVIGQVTFADSPGLEACFYDTGTKSFFVNNDGGGVVAPVSNLHGEVDVIDPVVSGLTAGTPAAPKKITYNSTLPAPAGIKAFIIPPANLCDPTGIVAGPGTDMAINCRPGTVGTVGNLVIMNRTTGAVVATINAGLGDQLWFDVGSNRYYNGASRWTTTGKSPGACAAATPCTPSLIIVDAAARTVVAILPAGNNAHSIAVDGARGKAYMPFSSPSVPAGCSTCATTLNSFGQPAFSSAGVAVYAIR